MLVYIFCHIDLILSIDCIFGLHRYCSVIWTVLLYLYYFFIALIFIVLIVYVKYLHHYLLFGILLCDIFSTILILFHVHLLPPLLICLPYLSPSPYPACQTLHLLYSPPCVFCSQLTSDFLSNIPTSYLTLISTPPFNFPESS